MISHKKIKEHYGWMPTVNCDGLEKQLSFFGRDFNFYGTQSSSTRITPKNICKWRLKALLAMLAFSMVTGVLLYTNMLVNELVERELNTVQFYAGIYDYYLKKPNSDLKFSSQYLLCDKTISSSSSPMKIIRLIYHCPNIH